MLAARSFLALVLGSAHNGSQLKKQSATSLPLCCCTSVFPQLTVFRWFVPAAPRPSRFVHTCNEQDLSKFLDDLSFGKLKDNNV